MAQEEESQSHFNLQITCEDKIKETDKKNQVIASQTFLQPTDLLGTEMNMIVDTEMANTVRHEVQDHEVENYDEGDKIELQITMTQHDQAGSQNADKPMQDSQDSLVPNYHSTIDFSVGKMQQLQKQIEQENGKCFPSIDHHTQSKWSKNIT